MQLVTWMLVFKTLSCERCVYAARIQHESQLSQLVHLNTLRAPCRGVAALEAIWVITAVLSLSSVCQLKHSQVNMTNISSVWMGHSSSNLLSLDW